MGYAGHIGRIGALAVALGVCAAVASPGTACAEPADSGSVSSPTKDSPSPGASPSSTAASPAGGAGASDEGSGEPDSPRAGAQSLPGRANGPRQSITESDTPPGDAEVGDDIDDSPDAGDETQGPTSGTGDDETLPTSDEEESVPTTGVEEDSEDAPPEVASTAAPTGQGGADAPDDVSTGSANHAVPGRPVAVDGSVRPGIRPSSSNAVEPPVTATAQPSTESVVSHVPTSSAAAAAVPAPAAISLTAPPVWELPGAVVGMASRLVAAILGPMLAPGTGDSTQSPLLWAVLGWVRRELQQLIFHRTSDFESQVVTIELDESGVSGPIALPVPEGGGLTYQVAQSGELGGPLHGTVTIDPVTGSFVYDPDDAFAAAGGIDTFFVTVSNADAGLLSLLSPTRTIRVTVNVVGTEASSPYFSDQELRDYLLTLAHQQYEGLFGQTVPYYEYEGPWWYDRIYTPGAQTDGVAGVSGTNTQVDGVDEADFVETDGQALYVVRNGQLTILDRDLNVLSQVTLSGSVAGAFLSGDRLTVITQSGSGGWYGPLVRVAWPGRPPWGEWNPQTTVTVFDVSDATAPTIAGKTIFDGAYRDARAVDGTVYLVLDTRFKLPEPLYTETTTDPGTPAVGDVIGLSPAGADIVAFPPWGWEPTVTSYRTYETWDEYVARVGDQIVNMSVPHTYTIDAAGNVVDLGPLLGAGDIVRPDSDAQQSLVTVVSIDSANPSAGSGFADSVARVVPQSGSAVYMTHGALYIGTAESHYSESSSSTNTRIDRFTIAGTKLAWQASGVVPGTLINQFAMDEQGGYLRVATHTWASQRNEITGMWSTVNENGVYVLDTGGRVLDEVGRLTGLAPGEQLFAVRFIGDKAFLVTFLQVDPLFAIDLSDPANPTLLGELKIPGFSNYLQPVGDGLLLGIGQEDSRVHASLFGVNDGTNLTQIERQFLDETAQWSWSQAQFDHHAVLYSPEDGVLVLPFASSGYDQWGYRHDQILKVLRVDANGIEVLGEIRTAEPVIRTVRIGDVLYAVSDNSVTAYRLDDLSVIGTVDIGELGQTPLAG